MRYSFFSALVGALAVFAFLADWWLSPSEDRAVSAGPVTMEPDDLPVNDTETGYFEEESASASSPAVAAERSEDWIDRLRLLMNEQDPRQLLEIARKLVDAIEPEKIPAILQQLGPEEFLTEYGRLLVARWTGAQPVAAGAWAAHLPSNKVSRGIRDNVAAALWRKDPQEAMWWVMTIHDPAEQIRLWIDMDYDREPPRGNRTGTGSGLITEVERWAENDLSGAAHWVLALPAGAKRETAIGQLASRWVCSDMRSAVAWVHTLSSERERQIAYAAIMAHLPTR